MNSGRGASNRSSFFFALSCHSERSRGTCTRDDNFEELCNGSPMNNISENLKSVRGTIEKIAADYARDTLDIRLMAVSKMQSEDNLRAALGAGQRLFGENKVQEAQQHWTALRAEYPDIELHLIGPLQTNKAKDAVTLFDVIQSIDRPDIVKALVKEMKKQNRFIPCLIQVNTGAEPQKAGVLPHDLDDLLAVCREEGIEVRGLMCIPPADEPPALHFAFLRKLADERDLRELSMGMSADYEKAIPLGSTYVRIGTALFGERAAAISAASSTTV